MEAYSCLESEEILIWLEKRNMARITPYLIEYNTEDNNNNNNNKISRRIRSMGKISKGKGVRGEEKGARVPNCDIWIFQCVLYLITRYLSSLWANRYLSYGL